MSAFRSFSQLTELRLSSTRYTPNRLFLSRESCMPLDLMMGLPVEETQVKDLDEFVARTQQQANECYGVAREHL